jgi:hypothetical protein
VDEIKESLLAKDYKACIKTLKKEDSNELWIDIDVYNSL